MPKSSSYESDPAYSRRRKRVTIVEETRKKHRKRGILIAVIVLIVALAAAFAVANLEFFKTTDEKLSLVESNADQALVAEEDNAPCYMLCVADLTRPFYAKSNDSDKAYMLIRIDKGSKNLSFLTIPAKLKIKGADGESREIGDMANNGGDAALISAIADFSGVSISHFARTDALRLEELVDLAGGIQMDVPGEIDDPNAGTVVIKKGEQTLDGKSALVLLRATNVYGGFSTCASNRVNFTLALANAALESKGIQFASLVGEASEYVETDLTAQGLLDLGDTFRPIGDATVFQVVVPYSEPAAGNDEGSYSVNSSDWERMKEAFVNGEDPSKIDEYLKDIDATAATIEIRNGAGINGAAARLSEVLGGYGYEVKAVGNTQDGIVYPETLIVYTDPSYADAAKVLVDQLGVGRIVNGGDFYSSKEDIIVIIGSDWVL